MAGADWLTILPVLVFAALIFFAVVPLAIWASSHETRERRRVSEHLAEWDAETRRLRSYYEFKESHPHIR